MIRRDFKGVIDVITGPMFSGKTEELIKRVRILEYADIKMLIVKPKVDNRFNENKIISRSGVEKQTISAKDGEEIMSFWNNSYDAIIIDEVQFFGWDIIPMIEKLASEGKRVIVAGLDTDYKMQPFGIMPHLLAIADNITKLIAVCLICKNVASKSFRKTKSVAITEVGDKDEYEARCRRCHIKGTKK
ncbi:MAG: thymidine kinase [Mycoplasmataceae bacterium]|nr:thymidine kinase [Mycoplasmataceae bacterium]